MNPALDATRLCDGDHLGPPVIRHRCDCGSMFLACGCPIGEPHVCIDDDEYDERHR